MREAGEGAAILALADDPLAPAEIAAVAAERGWAAAPVTLAEGSALRLVPAPSQTA
jgi:hypothetical protein